MLGRKLKNSGMTLVEVLVSMFVLSIAAVTVISAFSAAAQVNTKAKRQQGAEALMENMLEYAEAGGEDFKGWFGVEDDDYNSPAPGVTPVPNVTTEELRNLKSGFLDFTVRITTDTAPEEYNRNEGTTNDKWLNDFKVIQFGGSDSNAILIDATGTSYDEQAKTVFHGFHEQAIIEHDAEEIAKTVTDPDYEPVLWQGTSAHVTNADGMLSSLDREIWIESQSEGGSTSKFRLVAYMAYTFTGSMEMPEFITSASSPYVYKIPLCYSEVFDSEASTETSPRHLNQIYVMYSEEVTNMGNVGNVDIRVCDPGQVMTVNLYVVKQATTGIAVTNLAGELTDEFKNAVSSGDFDRYYGGAAGDVYISCYASGTSTDQSPKSATIYSPSRVLFKSGEYNSTKVIAKSNDLVAEGDEVRVVTVTIEIIDQTTGKRVLTPQEVTRLQ